MAGSLGTATGTSLAGLAADEDPELGLVGVKALRQAADVLEEYQVGRARGAGWTWAQIAEVLEVSPQAVHQKHGPKRVMLLASEDGAAVAPDRVDSAVR